MHILANMPADTCYLLLLRASAQAKMHLKWRVAQQQHTRCPTATLLEGHRMQ